MARPIVDRVRDAGIIGAGGAGFPTHVKVAARADTVIANGAECEPLLRCDKAVLLDRTDAVLRGLAALAEATAATRVVLALKGHYRDLVRHVRAAAARALPGVEVFELGNFYPAGDEQVLVHAVTGRVVPEGGIPIHVGVVVQNVVTLSQVGAAVESGRPVTRRPLTVAGAVRRPTTCELPIGAPLRAAIERAGGPTVSSWVMLEGGPMMGRLVASPDEPVTKKTSGVIVLPADHPLAMRRHVPLAHELRRARAVCCQCRMCTDLCPRHNLGHAVRPHLAMRAVATEGMADAPPEHITAAYLCSLCGVCEAHACTLGLSPRRVFGELRAALGKASVPNPHRRSGTVPSEAIESRRVPLPRLIARLGLADYAAAAHAVDWSESPVDRVRVLLSQHTGAPAVPVVSVGQSVREGDLIAEIPDGKLGARQHASLTGQVVAVDDRAIEIASC